MIAASCRNEISVPLTSDDQHAVEMKIKSLEYMMGTNISAVEKSGRYTIKVYTKAVSGQGGDLIELEKKSGEWIVINKGSWME